MRCGVSVWPGGARLLACVHSLPGGLLDPACPVFRVFYPLVLFSILDQYWSAVLHLDGEGFKLCFPYWSNIGMNFVMPH